MLGYSKKQFNLIFQDIIYIVAIQLAFLGLELDSKYGIELSVGDQKTLDLFIYRFKAFILLTFIWTIFTAFYFYYRYGVSALIIYLIITVLMFGYVLITYHTTAKRVSINNNLKLRYFNSSA